RPTARSARSSRPWWLPCTRALSAHTRPWPTNRAASSCPRRSPPSWLSRSCCRSSATTSTWTGPPFPSLLSPGLLSRGLSWRGRFVAGRSGGGRYGLLEPAGPRLGVDAVASADVIIAPGVAVAADGVRLGRGGGSYDRALARAAPPALVVVPLYDGEVVDSLP